MFVKLDFNPQHSENIPFMKRFLPVNITTPEPHASLREETADCEGI